MMCTLRVFRPQHAQRSATSTVPLFHRSPTLDTFLACLVLLKRFFESPHARRTNTRNLRTVNTIANRNARANQVTMLSSVLDVIDLEGRNHGDEIRVGGFDLIHAGGPTSNTSPSAPTRGGAGMAAVGGLVGEKNSLYTTALGAEIPQQRVDRMPRTPESSTHLPPSGAGGSGGNGNGTEGGGVRRHSSSSSGEAGGGGPVSSPARSSAKVGGSGGSGGSGGCNSSGSSSGSARSSSSLARGSRTTSSSESLSKGDGGRASRNDGMRGQSRGSERGGGGAGSGGGSGGGGNRGAAAGKNGGKSGDHSDSNREHRDRVVGGGGKDGGSRSYVWGNRDSRGVDEKIVSNSNPGRAKPNNSIN